MSLMVVFFGPRNKMSAPLPVYSLSFAQSPINGLYKSKMEWFVRQPETRKGPGELAIGGFRFVMK